MKQRRIFIGLFLILAVLALGIAYAAITAQTLTIGGNITASTSDANFDVSFVGDVTTSGDGTVTGYIDTADKTGRSVVINVSNLTTAGQEAMATVRIKNNSTDVRAKLERPTVTHVNDEWFSVEANLAETTYWLPGTGELVLIPGEETTLGLYIELLDTPATNADIAEAVDTFNIKINAEAISANEELMGYGWGEDF